MKTTMQYIKNMGYLFTLMIVGLMLSFTAADVQAQSVPAGTLIGNQASATYQDAAGNSRTVTSNVVNTQIEQVASLTFVANGSRLVSPGGSVSFPHTITNTGNGADVFNLSQVSTSGVFTFANVRIYPDANGDGVPDDLNEITQTPSIAQNGTFKIVVVGTVPGSAASGNAETITVTATSAFNNAVTLNVTDVATVSLNAVVNINKTMSANSGVPGSGPFTITLGYTNTGNNAATNLVIADLLPAGMVYVAGSGRWSQTGTTAMTDDNTAEADAGITYDYNVTTGGATTATISTVGAGQSGTVSFQVTISGTATPGNINNVATYNYNDGSGVQNNSSNTFVFTVLPGYAVAGTGATVASATQGSTVSFTNVITNNGNQVDVFNMTVQSSTFPAGSSVILFKTDGVSPLLDTNGDGIADTGPVAVGGTFNVVLKVTLPSSATGGPFTLVKRATSINGNNVFADMSDILTIIAGNTVDLTATRSVSGTDGNAAAADGLGAYTNGDNAAATSSTNPGQTVRFTLFVNNTSAVSDNFDLVASTNQDFGTMVLPTGWSITFRNASEQVIANSGVINTGAYAKIFADVLVPNGTSPGTNDIFFRSKSPATNATDRIRVNVTVNTVREITITPNNSGQIFPGGSVTYVHTITNVGNVTENNPANSTITLDLTNSNGGFNAVIYLDANNNGQIDTGESIVSNAANLGEMLGGQSKQLIVKVTATPGVNEGLNNTTTITATTANVAYVTAIPAAVFATDVTIVINSNVSLVKRQAKADVNGDASTAFQTTLITAKPGERIIYEITVTNLGTTPINNVQINDAIPPYTTYNANGQSTAFISNSAGGGTIAHNAGTISANLNQALAPGSSVTIRFGVTINN